MSHVHGMTRVFFITLLGVILQGNGESITAVQQESTPEPAFIFSDEPPPGFEDLEEIKQNALVDIFFRGQLIGRQIATFNAATITLSDPTAITKKITILSHPSQVTAALTGSLPAHADRACQHAQDVNCGFLTEEKTGVIFNPNTLKVIIKINPQHLKRPSGQRIYTPIAESSAALGILDRVNIRAQQGTGSALQLSMNHNSLISDGPNHFIATAAMSYPFSNARFPLAFSQLTGVRVQNNKKFRIGMIENVGDFFVRNYPLLGVAMETFEEMIDKKDIERGNAINLEVFMPQPGQIIIKKGAQTLLRQRLDSGYHFLDTTRFPVGSYTIVIERDLVNGKQDIEERDFIKNNRLPPYHFPLYFASMGLIQKSANSQQALPSYAPIPVFQIRQQRRISDRMGLMTALTANTERALFSLENTLIKPRYELRSFATFSTDGDVGIGIEQTLTQNNHEKKRITGSLAAQKVWAAHHNATTIDNVSFDPITVPSFSVNASLRYPVKKGYITLRGNYTKTDQNIDWSYGGEFRIPLYSQDSQRIDFTFRVDRKRNQNSANINIDMTFPTGDFTHSLNNHYTTTSPSSPSATGVSTQLNTQVQKRDQFGTGFYFQNLASRTPQDDRALSTSLEYTHQRYGRFDSRVQQDWEASGRHTINGSLDLLTQITYADHQWVFGGQEGRNASTIISIVGGKKTDLFDVLVNERTVARIPGQSNISIGLQAYETYEISVRSNADTLYSYDAIPRRITVYEGNVIHLRWEVKQKHLIIAQVHYPDGVAVKAALVEGGVGLNAIDSEGDLQAEITDGTRTLQVKPVDGPPCQLRLPDNYVLTQSFADLGTLICTPHQ